MTTWKAPQAGKKKPRAKNPPAYLDANTNKEAFDILGLFVQDPGLVQRSWPNLYAAITGDLKKTFVPQIKERIQARYANGKCSLCGGKASVCGPRHAKGMSCG